MSCKFTEIIRHRLGWCPHVQTLPTIPPVVSDRAYPVPSQAGGADGPQGRLSRSFLLALGSARILIRNRRLLWFSLLSGILMILTLAATISLHAVFGITPIAGDTGETTPPAFMALSPAWLFLTFTINLLAILGSTLVLAGLIYSVSGLFHGRTTTLREGLAQAGHRILPITLWALLFAMVGTAQSSVINIYQENFLLLAGIEMPLLALGFLTTFVIPLVILENRRLAGAVTGSITLVAKTWSEILLCGILYILVAAAVAFLSLVPTAAIGFPSGSAGILAATIGAYLIVLTVMMVIGTTLFGIALTGLYRYGTTGQLPDAFS